MMENWVSKVGDYSACIVISLSMVYRWGSRCSRLRKHRLASRYARTASSRTAQQDRQIMRQSGECCLPRHTRPIERSLRHCRSVPLGLVTASAPGQALVDNTALLETREAEFNFDTDKPFKINADTNGVCESFLAVRRQRSLFLVYRPGIIHSDPPRGYRE
jgi:hypothetical protein